MTEAKHTPGEWMVCFTHFSKVLASNGALVATCNRLNSLTGLQANARLIAAAPELLAACQKFMYSVPHTEIRGETGSLLEVVREAITKATGEQA